MIDFAKYPIRHVKLSSIKTSDQRYQFRKDPDVEAMKASLKKDGQKYPIILIELANGEQIILCGWTRELAAAELGWEDILAIVIPDSDFADDDEKCRAAYIENAKRRPLNNLDIMFACKKLSKAGKSNVKIGEIMDKSEAQVRRYLKVADATPEQQKAFEAGQTSINAISGEGVVVHDEAKPHGLDTELVVHDEAKPKNSNIHVKSVKNGFDASLKFRVGRDGAEVVKSFVAQVNAAYKETQKAQEDGGKDDAEAEKKANEAKAGRIAEAIKDLEACAKKLEKDGLDPAGITPQIKELKAKLKAIKSGNKGETIREDAGPVADVQPRENDTETGRQSQLEQLKQIRYTIEEGGPAALADFMVRPIEIAIDLMKKQVDDPKTSDGEKAKLQLGIQKLQAKIDEIKRKETGQGKNTEPNTQAPNGQSPNDAELEKQKEQNRKMILGFRESLKTTVDRERLEQVAKAQGFNTPEEYIDNMEQNLKKQGLL